MNLDLENAEKLIDLSKAPFRMHEFFAGSGLVAYGMKGMFMPVWSNDINDRKASVYKANFVSDHFLLGDIKDVKGDELPPTHLSWASFAGGKHERDLCRSKWSRMGVSSYS